MIYPHWLEVDSLIKVNGHIARFKGMEGPYLRWEQPRELGYKGSGKALMGLAYLDWVRLPTSLELELL